MRSGSVPCLRLLDVEALSDTRTKLADFFNGLLIDEANSFKCDHLAQAGIELKQDRTKYGRS